MDTERQNTINTNGGSFVSEGVNIDGGDFIGHDKNIYGDEIKGNKVIGTIIENLTGDFIVAPPLSRVPPNELTIHAYLKRAVEKDNPPDGPKTQQFAKLWAAPFRAHQASHPSQNLYHAVQTIFSHASEGEAFQRLVILADAGMGKTPALYYIRRKCAENSLSVLSTNAEETTHHDLSRNINPKCVIPLYINLTNLFAGLSLVTLVRDSFNSLIEPTENVDKITPDEASALLETHVCLFLFDALGKLHTTQHEGNLQTVSQLVETHPSHQYIFTCRTANYRHQLGAMYELYLADLEVAEARSILGEDVYARLSGALKQLAQNRGMLKIILELDEADRMSHTKGKLLQAYIFRRLKNDDDIRIDMMEGLLEQLAFSMHCERTHHYSEHRLMEVVTAYLKEWHEPYHWRQVVKDLCVKEMLMHNDERQWSFRDRSAQVYFAASAAAHDAARLQGVLNDVSNLWWREVIEILIGLTSKPIQLLFDLIDRDVFVAANSIRFAGNISDQLVEDALVDTLLERLGQESSSQRIYIVERIGESKHPRSTQALLIALRREWSSRVVLAICQALLNRLERKRGGLKKVESFQTLSSSQKLEWIISMLERFRAKGSEALLESYVQNAELPSQVRGVSAICLGFLNTSQALAILLKLFFEQKLDDFIAWCIVDALTLFDHPEIMTRAIKVYDSKTHKSRQWASLRARAVYLLGWTNGNNETANLLRKALRDRDAYVRGYTIDSIVRLDLKDRRQLIEQLLLKETEPFVLRRAAEALGRIGTDDSVAVLERHLQNERARTRWMVRKAITEIRQRTSLQ